MQRIPFLVWLCVLLQPFPLAAQLEPFGLEGRTVYDLGFYGGRLYAATDTGVFAWREDIAWKLIGLQGKKVLTVYPHDWGPIGYAVTAGVQRTPGDTSSPLIYCSRYSDTAWVVADSGIDRSAHLGIRSIRGFPSPMI